MKVYYALLRYGRASAENKAKLETAFINCVEALTSGNGELLASASAAGQSWSNNPNYTVHDFVEVLERVLTKLDGDVTKVRQIYMRF